MGNVIELKIGDYNFTEFDENVTKIDAWYDRHTKDYCIQLLNKDGFQIGDAIRVGTKADKDSVVEGLRKEYGL